MACTLSSHFEVESYEDSILGFPLQNCPQCGEIISAFPGSRDAFCHNCGYKDPCCGD